MTPPLSVSYRDVLLNRLVLLVVVVLISLVWRRLDGMHSDTDVMAVEIQVEGHVGPTSRQEYAEDSKSNRIDVLLSRQHALTTYLIAALTALAHGEELPELPPSLRLAVAEAKLGG